MTTSHELPEIEWSAAEKACWDLLGARLARDRLRPGSIDAYRKAYALWLRYLRSAGTSSPLGSPMSDVPSALLHGFLDALRRRTSAATTLNIGRRLRRLIHTADPAARATSLDAAIARARRELPLREGAGIPLSSEALLREGRRLIASGKARLCRRRSSAGTAAEGRILVRDGLMVALLAMRPMRIGAFVGLRLRDSVILYRAAAWLRIRADQSKTGCPMEIPFPPMLFADLLFYLRRVRPSFRGSTSRTDLWASDRGPMSEELALQIIHRVSVRAFGFSVSPHYFRHAAATFLAEDHPAFVRLATDILGHADPVTTERFYNHARPWVGAAALRTNLMREARRARRPQQHGARARLPAAPGHA